MKIYIKSSLYKEPQDYTGMFGILLLEEFSSKLSVLVYDTERKAMNALHRLESKPTRDNMTNEAWTGKAFDYMNKVSESSIDSDRYYPDDRDSFVTLINNEPVSIRRR